MKFKRLHMNESVLEDFDSTKNFSFDKEIRWEPATDIFGNDTKNCVVSGEYDDDFSSPEYIPDMEMTPPEGPKAGSDIGISDLLISAINDEWEAIRQYNSLVAALQYEVKNNPEYESFFTVINDILAEENKHVGQLQEVLKTISPNVESIEQGEVEGQQQLKSPMLMNVQFWDDSKTEAGNSNEISSTCTLSDIDDEM